MVHGNFVCAAERLNPLTLRSRLRSENVDSHGISSPLEVRNFPKPLLTTSLLLLGMRSLLIPQRYPDQALLNTLDPQTSLNNMRSHPFRLLSMISTQRPGRTNPTQAFSTSWDTYPINILLHLLVPLLPVQVLQTHLHQGLDRPFTVCWSEQSLAITLIGEWAIKNLFEEATQKAR